MKEAVFAAALGLSLSGLAAQSAMAAGPIRIGYVDPLSGGGASAGQIGLRELNFIARQVDAKGGVLGRQVKIIPYDNKLSPQTSLVQVQKAIDDGVDIIVQGTGSSAGSAIESFVTRYNERNPGKGVVYLNYGAIDPSITNANCSYWQFSFDANVDVKMQALTHFIHSQPGIKKVYLINQDYDFGHSVADAAARMLKQHDPGVRIVGDEFHPLLKVTDFSPYIAKIKASGADSVITADWGQDLALLLKAAGDAGLKVNWYTYYAGLPGGPTAIKQADLPDRVFQVNEGVNNVSYAPARRMAATYIASHKDDPFFYPKLFNLTGMLFQAMREAGSAEPVKFVPKLEGMRYKTFSSGDVGFMRAQDHQFFQPLFISTFGPVGGAHPFLDEGTGWGWKVVAKIPSKATVLPTTCHMKRP
jgi:branched-chain amino acid transport system substrate-binding protein